MSIFPFIYFRTAFSQQYLRFPMASLKRKNSYGNTSLSVIMFLCFLFVIHLVHSISAEESSYVPVDNKNIVLNCRSSISSEFEFSTVSRVSVQDPENPKSRRVFACFFQSKFTYPFPVSAGPKLVQLHFYPISYPGYNISKALFSVSIGRYTVLQTSKSSYSRDASNFKPTMREFFVHVDGQILNVTFTPSPNSSDAYGFVNKIEVVSMPSNFYVRGDVPLPLIGHPSRFFVANSTALETMHRLNVGGHTISAEHDTGMLRTWSGDVDYLTEVSNDTKVVHSEVKINYSSLVPAYTAPVKVYATARTSKSAVSWLLPIDSGFCYLLRLHFCEITREITQDQRVFHVYVNGLTAEDHADVIHWSNGSGIPVYRDYVVNFSRHSQGIQDFILEIKSNTTHYHPILNGLEIFKLSDANNNLAGPNPFGAKASMSHSLLENHPNIVLIPMGLLIGLALVQPLLYFFCLKFPSCPLWLVLFSRFRWRRTPFMQWQLSPDECRHFSFAEIKSATKNFSEDFLIGSGGFGKVYKGYIDDGATKVAVKRGNPTSHQGLHEFQTEITMLSNLRHCHLVSLIGYCMEYKEMILVYDYMSRGTLRDHLYKTQKPPLPWKQRLKICIGAARGLHYLHTGARHSIIHRDVKTTNILLDKKWAAKVSDFGLSKVGPNMLTQSSDTHVSTAVKGSFGYLDPEYYRRQKLTEKSDVYSFGVVLFEVLCARPAVLPMAAGATEEEHEQANLAEWVLHCCQIGILDQIIDPYLNGKIAPECFKTFTEIANKCLAGRGNERPPMGDVLWNLELAWQQQICSESAEEGTCCGGSKRIGGDVSVMIDCQRGVGCGNSDPTPGAEFSEIMFPSGR